MSESPIFDKFVKAVEKIPVPTVLKKLATKSRLFHFSGDPAVFLKKEYTREEIEYLQTQFFLPFPYVAAEDDLSCVFLTVNEEETSPRSILDYTFKFADVVVLFNTKSSYVFGENQEARKELFEYAKSCGYSNDTVFVVLGEARLEDSPPNQFLVKGDLGRAAFLDPNREEKFVDVTPPIVQSKQLSAGFLRSASAAIQEFAMLADTKKFILERTPQKDKTPRKNKKHIRRSHERPFYTILNPNEIRKQMHLPSPTEKDSRGKVRPHERRAHLRTYHSERFVNVQGESRLIKSTWIGESENTVGNHRYKVIL